MAFENTSFLSPDVNLLSSKPLTLFLNFGKNTQLSSCVTYKPAAAFSYNAQVLSNIAADDLSSTLTHVRLHESDFCLQSSNSLQGDFSSEQTRKHLNKILLLVTADQEGDPIQSLQMKQSVYQNELQQITEWWNELGFSPELKRVRNQPLKWYTWSMVALIDDLNLSKQRTDLTKTIAFVYLIDDIFDLYGMPDELKTFVQAVNKWDYAAIDTLPDYMKKCYRVLLETTNETALNVYMNHGFNPIDHLKAVWVSLCDAFLVEAKWFASGELPTSDEYLVNGMVSSGAHVVLVHLFFHLGLGGTKNPSVNLKDISELVSYIATILRLWDDLGSAKDENQDGKDGSYVEYYMKEHKSLSVEQAQGHVVDLISNKWKCLNKECCHLHNGPALPFTKACLNLAKMLPLMYNNSVTLKAANSLKSV